MEDEEEDEEEEVEEEVEEEEEDHEKEEERKRSCVDCFRRAQLCLCARANVCSFRTDNINHS